MCCAEHAQGFNSENKVEQGRQTLAAVAYARSLSEARITDDLLLGYREILAPSAVTMRDDSRRASVQGLGFGMSQYLQSSNRESAGGKMALAHPNFEPAQPRSESAAAARAGIGPGSPS